MPRRSHAHREDDESPPSTRPRLHPGRPQEGSIRSFEDSVSEHARTGRPGMGRGSTGRDDEPGGTGLGSEPPDLVTNPTGTPGGRPEGHQTAIETDDDFTTRRSIEMENSAAVTLAGSGWRVKQNPSPPEVAQSRRQTGDVGDPRKNPDYLIEGKVFDCYAPTSPAKPPRGIWSETKDKVDKRQTQRVVVNLQDWRGDLAGVRKQFLDWPIPGIKEVKVITSDGTIVQITLAPTED